MQEIVSGVNGLLLLLMALRISSRNSSHLYWLSSCFSSSESSELGSLPHINAALYKYTLVSYCTPLAINTAKLSIWIILRINVGLTWNSIDGVMLDMHTHTESLWKERLQSQNHNTRGYTLFSENWMHAVQLLKVYELINLFCIPLISIVWNDIM